jgi:hypothetical protein
MRVQLVVTGDMEQLALGLSLERILSTAGGDVQFLRPRKLGDGAITTCPLPALATPRTPTTVTRMAKALVTETLSGRTGSAPDLVVGIDDLELANIHQPHVVVAWIRRAIDEEVTARYPSRDAAERIKTVLRERCSFHLLVPLVEAYLFGEPAALARAGVASGVAVHRLGADVESFETNDPAFLPRAAAENAKKAALGAPWWREERHPKRYLEFLVESSGALLYDETVEGVRALRTLDWPRVASSSALLFARALFEDISDLLGISNPLGPGICSSHTYPAKNVRRESLMLRNL